MAAHPDFLDSRPSWAEDEALPAPHFVVWWQSPGIPGLPTPAFYQPALVSSPASAASTAGSASTVAGPARASISDSVRPEALRRRLAW